MEKYRVRRISAVTGEVIEDHPILFFTKLKEKFQLCLNNSAKEGRGYVAAYSDHGDDGLRFIHPSRFGWK